MKRNIAISTKNLCVWYNHLQALKNISIQIPEKQITALIGASGSGKSTFLRSLNRIIENTPQAQVEGEIIIHGKNIFDPSVDVAELRRKVGMVFQNPTPFPKSIYDNIAYGLEIQGVHNPHGLLHAFLNRHYAPLDLLASTDPLDIAVVSSLMQAALWEEVKDRLHQSAYRLSGGQQQRLCIARALAVQPNILLLDEPCSALDPISTQKIEKQLLTLKKFYTIIIVTHNLHQARRISDHIGFLHLTKLVEFGTTKQVFTAPREKLTRDYVQGHFG